MLQRFQRTANAMDRVAIEAAIATAEKKRGEEVLATKLAAAFGIIPFGILLYLWRPVTPITLGIAVGLYLLVLVIGGASGGLTNRWVKVIDWKELRESRAEIDALRKVLTSGPVYVLHCEATDVAALLDDDKEISYYAFQVAPNRVFFMSDCGDLEGKFPSSVFEVIAATEDTTDFIAIHTLGTRLAPRARIAEATWSTHDEVEEEEEVPGTLEGLSRKAAA